MNRFSEKIRRASASIIRWKLLAAAGLTALGLALALGLLALYDTSLPLREGTAALALLAAFLLGAAALAAVSMRVVQRRPGAGDIARAVEEGHPELLDLLNCAADIAGREGEPSGLENVVVEEAERRTAAIDFSRETAPSSPAKAAAVAALAVAIGVFLAASGWGPVTKAKAALADLLAGQNSGLSVTPGSGEFPTGSDIAVGVEVHRGPSQVEIEYTEAGESHRVPMRARGEGFEFVFYDVGEPVRYRALTPTLASDWYTLTVYTPPEIKAASWTVTPPAYTGEEPGVFEGFERFSVLAGSAVTGAFSLAPENVQAELVNGLERQAAAGGETPGARRVTWKPKETATYHLALADAAGHTATSAEIEIKVLPDSPPVVEITAPAKDTEAPPDGTLPVEAFTADDYGVARAEIRVSVAGEKHVFPLALEAGQKEQDLAHRLDFAALGARAGDVVSYHIVVTDNREPDPQEVRSEVYFVEIVPPEAEPREGPGGEGEQKELPVRALINETKQVIRKNYAALDLAPEEAAEEARAIEADTVKLKNALNKLYAENRDQFPTVEGTDTGQLVLDAIDAAAEAERASAAARFEDALGSGEVVLGKLVQLYNLLKDDPMMSREPSSGQGEGESQPQESEPQETAESQEGQNPAEQLQEMREALDRTRELAERQRSLNAQIGRNARTGRTGEPNRQLAGEQGGIGAATQQLYDDIYRQTGDLSKVNPLERAGREMGRSESGLNRDDPTGAEPHGIRAAEALDSAADTLQSAIFELASDILGGLQEQAEALAGEQGGTRESTQDAQPGGGQADALRSQQQSVNSGAGSLLGQIERTAADLQETSEEATQALYGIAQNARQAGIESSGKRAANALLYEAFPQAAREQAKVERDLLQVAEQLGQARQELDNQSNAALTQLIEEIEAARERLPGMQPGEQQETGQELAGRVGGLKETETDVRLQERTQQIENWADSAARIQGQADTDWLLKNTADLLRAYLWQRAVNERLSRNRELTIPPKKYKRQVEEYYRRLAEEL